MNDYSFFQAKLPTHILTDAIVKMSWSDGLNDTVLNS